MPRLGVVLRRGGGRTRLVGSAWFGFITLMDGVDVADSGRRRRRWRRFWVLVFRSTLNKPGCCALGPHRLPVQAIESIDRLLQAGSPPAPDPGRPVPPVKLHRWYPNRGSRRGVGTRRQTRSVLPASCAGADRGSGASHHRSLDPDDDAALSSIQVGETGSVRRPGDRRKVPTVVTTAPWLPRGLCCCRCADPVRSPSPRQCCEAVREDAP